MVGQLFANGEPQAGTACFCRTARGKQTLLSLGFKATALVSNLAIEAAVIFGNMDVSLGPRFAGLDGVLNQIRQDQDDQVRVPIGKGSLRVAPGGKLDARVSRQISNSG